MIWCLMVQGQGLDDAVRNMLFDTAQVLFRAKKKKQRFICPDKCEGIVTTDFSFASLGSAFGVVFEATVDVGNLTTRARFIARPCDLSADGSTWGKTTLDELTQKLGKNN